MAFRFKGEKKEEVVCYPRITNEEKGKQEDDSSLGDLDLMKGGRILRHRRVYQRHLKENKKCARPAT